MGISVRGLKGGLEFTGSGIGTSKYPVRVSMLELGVPGVTTGVACVELGVIGVDFCEPGVGGERGDVNRVESA